MKEVIKSCVSKLRNKKLGICFFSSYPPRECGIATFTSALKNAVKKNLPDLIFKIVAVEEPNKKRKY